MRWRFWQIDSINCLNGCKFLLLNSTMEFLYTSGGQRALFEKTALWNPAKASD